MNLAAALTDARQILRVRRAQAGVWRRYRATLEPDKPTARRARFTLWAQRALGLSFPAAPLLIPLFTWFAVRENGGPWRLLAFLLVLVFRNHFFQAQTLEFSAADMLRTPSKGGLLLLRLYHRGPWFLFVGCCLAVACAIAFGEALVQAPVQGSLLLGAIGLSPVAQTIGKLRARLIGGAASVLGPLLVPTLACIFLYSESGTPLDLWRILVGILVGALGLAALVRMALQWTRQPRLHLRVMAAELTLLPHTMVGLGLLVPAVHLQNAASIPWLPAIALATVILVSLHSLARLVAEVHHAEESTSGSAIQRADGHAPRRERPVRAALPATCTSRRSLLRATLFLHRRTHWFGAGELASPLRIARNLPRLLPMLLHHAWGPLLAGLAMERTTGAHAQLTLALLAGLTAPIMVSIQLNWQLHRLGVDFAAQAKHNLRALALLAALPTLLTAAVVGTFGGWNGARTLVVAILAATFLLRAGWRGFAKAKETERWNSGAALAGLAAIAASPWLPAPALWAVLLAAATGALGLLLRLHRLEETSLADAMRADGEIWSG